MRFFAFPPFSNSQYHFLLDKKDILKIKTFYEAGTLKSKILWNLFMKLKFIRYLFSKNIQSINIDSLNEKKILAFLKKENDVKVILFENADKTISILKVKNIDDQLAKNESNVLKQLQIYPKFKNNFHENLTMNKRELTFPFINGLKNYHYEFKNPDLFISLNKMKIKSEYFNFSSDKLITAFAHGDFCPWNMIIRKDDVSLFDWEFAGQYPLGYDLFTYLIQKELLLYATKDYKRIIEIFNDEIIFEYFNHFKITNFNDYILEFLNIKSCFNYFDNALKVSYKTLLDYFIKN